MARIQKGKMGKKTHHQLILLSTEKLQCAAMVRRRRCTSDPTSPPSCGAMIRDQLSAFYTTLIKRRQRQEVGVATRTARGE